MCLPAWFTLFWCIDGWKLTVALDEFGVVGIHRNKNRIYQTPTMKTKFMHIGMYKICPTLLLLFLMICRCSIRCGKPLKPLVLANDRQLWCLSRVWCHPIQLDHRLFVSQHCLEEGGWKQYGAILMAPAWGWWIDTSDRCIKRWYDKVVNLDGCNWMSDRLQPDNLRALGLQGGAQSRRWATCL